MWGSAIDNLGPFNASQEPGRPTGTSAPVSGLSHSMGLLVEQGQTVSHTRPWFLAEFGMNLLSTLEVMLIVQMTVRA